MNYVHSLAPTYEPSGVGNSKGLHAFTGPLHIAGGFWAVILTRPAWARCWASVWSCSKHVVVDKVCALNRWYGMGPAYDSLDHRVRVCYLPRSLHTMNFVMPLACTALLVPLFEFWMCITLSQSRVPSFWSKNGCTFFTNWLSCWSRKSMAKCSGQLDKVAI